MRLEDGILDFPAINGTGVVTVYDQIAGTRANNLA